MKIYIVGISDCESNKIKYICKTKEVAEKYLFKLRDELIAEWKEMDKFINDENKFLCIRYDIDYKYDNTYLKMIENLSSDDYKNWNNYPHSVVVINEMELT